MSIKQKVFTFLKPSIGKIVLTIILLLYFFFTTALALSMAFTDLEEPPPGNIMFAFALTGFIVCLPYWILEEYTHYSPYLYLLIELAYLYIVSCGIVWLLGIIVKKWPKVNFVKHMKPIQKRRIIIGFALFLLLIFFGGILAERISKNDMSSFIGYYTDKGIVYHFGSVVVGADAETLETFNFYYAKDSESGYFEGNRISGSDAKSFIAINEKYAKDESHIYRYGELTDIIEINSFHDLGLDYARSDNLAYYKDVPIDGADSSTFEMLGWGYAKDANRVYYEGVPIPGADAESFELTAYGRARDKAFTYRDGQLILPTY